MNYFVLGEGAAKYGPVTVDVLTQWAAEGRIHPQTMLEDAATMQQVRAQDVPGIIWLSPQVPPSVGSMPNYGGSPYPRDPYAAQNMTPSWIDKQFLNTGIGILVLGSLCCAFPMLVFSLVGYLTCTIPEAKDKARVALIVSGILTVVGFASRLFLLTSAR